MRSLPTIKRSILTNSNKKNSLSNTMYKIGGVKNFSKFKKREQLAHAFFYKNRFE